jgi:hypothetical protein
MLTKDFILAGKALFTVSNGKGQHFTFKVRKQTSEQWGDKWFASVRTHQEGRNYLYIGVVNPVSGVPHLTKASKYPKDSIEYKVLRWVLDIVWGRYTLPAGYEIKHAGRCGRCGRTLTTPDSIKCGIGPECRKSMGLLGL